MYYLSLAAVFKEETKWLKEWLDYHILVGVDHFFLYIQDIDEELNKVLDILRPYPKRLITTQPFEYNKFDFQVKVYDLILKKYGSKTKWMGFIDLDEFVFPVKEGLTLPDILSHYERDEIKGLNASVCTFGDSFLTSSPSSQIRDLTWKSFVSRPCNFTSKQFFLTEKIKEYVYGGCWNQCVDEDYKRPIACKSSRPMQKIRVNHYPIRSKEDWQKKVKRGWPGLTESDWKHKHNMLNNNDVKDTLIHRYLSSLAPS